MEAEEKMMRIFFHNHTGYILDGESVLLAERELIALRKAGKPSVKIKLRGRASGSDARCITFNAVLTSAGVAKEA
jgi:hypothetical protein